MTIQVSSASSVCLLSSVALAETSPYATIDGNQRAASVATVATDENSYMVLYNYTAQVITTCIIHNVQSRADLKHIAVTLLDKKLWTLTMTHFRKQHCFIIGKLCELVKELQGLKPTSLHLVSPNYCKCFEWDSGKLQFQISSLFEIVSSCLLKVVQEKVKLPLRDSATLCHAVLCLMYHI